MDDWVVVGASGKARPRAGSSNNKALRAAAAHGAAPTTAQHAPHHAEAAAPAPPSSELPGWGAGCSREGEGAGTAGGSRANEPGVGPGSRSRRGRHRFRERSDAEVAADLLEQVAQCRSEVRHSAMYASLQRAFAAAVPHLNLLPPQPCSGTGPAPEQPAAPGDQASARGGSEHGGVEAAGEAGQLAQDCHVGSSLALECQGRGTTGGASPECGGGSPAHAGTSTACCTQGSGGTDAAEGGTCAASGGCDAAPCGTNAPASSAAAAASPWARIQELVVFGLGSMQTSITSRYQLALAQLLATELLPGLARAPLAFDPAFTAADTTLLKALGFSVMSDNAGCAHRAHAPTFFYLPHLEGLLCNSLLAANAALGTPAPPPPQLPDAGGVGMVPVHQQEQGQGEQAAVDGCTGARGPEHAAAGTALHHCVLLANRFSSYEARRGPSGGVGQAVHSSCSCSGGSGASGSGEGGACGAHACVPPVTMMSLIAAGAVVELAVDDGRFHAPSAFNDMALHVFPPLCNGQ